jgi:hypothetical protein
MAEVNAARKEYRSAEQQWDAALMKAHDSGHGTADYLKYLQEANQLGAEVLNALARYQEAVRRLLESMKRP